MDTSGREAISAANPGLRLAISDTIAMMAAEISVLMMNRPMGMSVGRLGGVSVALLDWRVGASLGAGVIGRRPDDLAVDALLDDMGRPAAGACDDE